MRLFHRTWAVYARAIIENGFLDGDEGFVWLANVALEPVDIKGGHSGDICLALDVPNDVVAAFLSLQRNGYIAHKIPAEQLNLCDKPWIVATNYSGMCRAEIATTIANKQAAEAGSAVPDNASTTFGRSESLVAALDLLDHFLIYR